MIGHWNHRVVKRTCPATKEVYYRIEECYYNKGRKTPRNMTDGCIVQGDSLESLKWTLKHMLKCLQDPIVNGDKFK